MISCQKLPIIQLQLTTATMHFQSSLLLSKTFRVLLLRKSSPSAVEGFYRKISQILGKEIVAILRTN
jgi:hypothetical protein